MRIYDPVIEAILAGYKVAVAANLRIISQPTGTTITEGTALTLTVSAAGYPAPSYQWEKLIDTVYTDITGATSNVYTVSDTVVSDSGSYRCRIYNISESIESNVAVVLVNAEGGGGNPDPGDGTGYVVDDYVITGYVS